MEVYGRKIREESIRFRLKWKEKFEKWSNDSSITLLPAIIRSSFHDWMKMLIMERISFHRLREEARGMGKEVDEESEEKVMKDDDENRVMSLETWGKFIFPISGVSKLFILLTTGNEWNVMFLWWKRKWGNMRCCSYWKKFSLTLFPFFYPISLFPLSSPLPPWIRSLSQRLIWISCLCLIWSNTNVPKLFFFLLVYPPNPLFFPLSSSPFAVTFLSS